MSDEKALWRRITKLELAMENMLRCGNADLCASCRKEGVRLLTEAASPGRRKRAALTKAKP